MDFVRQLTATYDPHIRLAHVEICLDEDSWDERERAIDKMIEIRTMFIDELSVDYAFSDGGTCLDVEKANAEYAYA